VIKISFYLQVLTLCLHVNNHIVNLMIPGWCNGDALNLHLHKPQKLTGATRTVNMQGNRLAQTGIQV
jgi:hypothetical protein